VNNVREKDAHLIDEVDPEAAEEPGPDQLPL